MRSKEEIQIPWGHGMVHICFGVYDCKGGIAESGFFVNLISTQMILQSLLLLNLLLIAFATKRLLPLRSNA